MDGMDMQGYEYYVLKLEKFLQLFFTFSKTLVFRIWCHIMFMKCFTIFFILNYILLSNKGCNSKKNAFFI